MCIHADDPELLAAIAMSKGEVTSQGGDEGAGPSNPPSDGKEFCAKSHLFSLLFPPPFPLCMYTYAYIHIYSQNSFSAVVRERITKIFRPPPLNIDPMSTQNFHPIGPKFCPSTKTEVEPEVDAEALQALMDMGFGRNRCVRAMFSTGSTSVEQCVQWYVVLCFFEKCSLSFLLVFIVFPLYLRCFLAFNLYLRVKY